MIDLKIPEESAAAETREAAGGRNASDNTMPSIAVEAEAALHTTTAKTQRKFVLMSEVG